jgi:aromatic-L-amino-acid decarboxylase
VEDEITEDRSLELQGPALRRLIDAAAERIVAHVASLPDQPSADVDGAEALARSLVEPMPETGAPADELLDLLFDRVIPKTFNTAGPGYLAYIPGGGLPQSAVADLISAATNRYVGVFAAAPGLAQLEANVCRWLCDLAGLPPSARGILTSGGSLATFSALVAARRDRLPEDFLSGRIYASDQTHHAVLKAALLAGFPESAVREVESDNLFRMRLDALERAIAEDRAAGRTPFLLVANAGTTNTGAVDDLAALAAVAERERLWLHVDAAYGGFFLPHARGRAAARRNRARRLGRARPAQGAVPPLRHRRAPRPRRRRASPGPCRVRRLHARDAGGPRIRGLQPPVARALSRLPRAARLAAAEAARGRPVPAQPRGEARARAARL